MPESPTLATLDDARVRWDGERLTIENAALRQTWKWSGFGLATAELLDLHTDRQWAKNDPTSACDWGIPGIIEAQTAATLIGVEAQTVIDDGYTSDHIEAVATIEYPDTKVMAQFVVWVYPNAPGLRTQLRVKGMAGYCAPQTSETDSSHVDCLPLSFGDATRRAIGYYNQTQQRNRPDTELLREELRESPLTDAETFDWASLLCVEDAADGVCLVKESHKCVNQQGVDTGAFVCDERGVVSTGSALRAKDVIEDRYRDCWASWRILYHGGDDERELAIKRFDRARYPIDPARDIYVMANTWGSTLTSQEGRKAAREENVLREIDSCADLGIEVLQIDDGWQVPIGHNAWKTDEWAPHPEPYPEGWRNVRAAAEAKGVTLGLWSAWVISSDELKANHDAGGFRYFKIDFSVLNDYDKLEGLMTRVRELIDHTGRTVRVNWDVTENPPRVGYYFAREFGNIYLENRKPEKPDSVVYIPSLVLRDAWHIARYTNLNKFQITAQNIDRVASEKSNAWRHNHPYCVAITLMAAPIFFQETQLYSEEAREQVRPLLALYKEHSRGIFDGYVFAIGDKPDDASWTGFQSHNPDTGGGYLTIFRELGAPDAERAIALRLLAGKTIVLEDLRGNETRTVEVSADGEVAFALEGPASFGFYRYSPATP